MNRKKKTNIMSYPATTLLLTVSAMPWAWLFALWNDTVVPIDTSISWGGTGVALSTLFAATITDFRVRKIPNYLTYSGVISILLVQCSLIYFDQELKPLLLRTMGRFPDKIDPSDPIGLQGALLGAIVCFAIVLVPYLLRQGGAGDAKLAAVIGAGLGISGGIFAIAVCYVVAATMGLIGIVWDKGPLFSLRALVRRFGHWFLPLWISPPSEEERQLLKEPTPLAPCFFVAVMLYVFGGSQLIS